MHALFMSLAYVPVSGWTSAWMIASFCSAVHLSPNGINEGVSDDLS